MNSSGIVAVVTGHEISKTFRGDKDADVRALSGVSFHVNEGSLTALVGPDGAGKTTLLRLAAGLIAPDSGQLSVLGIDVVTDPSAVQARLGYMPQRFGLYEDLSVQENLDLYADVHGVPVDARAKIYEELMAMTGLGPFTSRLAGHLSGGMKQKLGLACTLVRRPTLLVLDEPTVGVDPVSRRELWVILLHLVHDQHLTVWLSTSYLDEAQWCDHVVVLHEGHVLAEGAPADVSALAAGRTVLVQPDGRDKARDLQARLLADPRVIDAVPEGGAVRVVLAARTSRDAGGGAVTLAGLTDGSPTPTAPRFEDGFMILQRARSEAVSVPSDQRDRQESTANAAGSDAVEVEVDSLVRRFGSFTAVDHVSFSVHRGEIFGLLGPNGAGKTTTFRMLCGLLPPTEGLLRIAGIDVRRAPASARRRIGYVAQKFSLYSQLSVVENLDFFAGAYGLRGTGRRSRVEWGLRQFDLEEVARLPSGRLPGGYKQRLAMAAALVHDPVLLFLDEPTSGADPLARRDFWRRITILARSGVTAVVTTHFMEEAEYCDHLAIMDAGRILAQGTPAEIRRRARADADRPATMEDAFLAIVQDARAERGAA